MISEQKFRVETPYGVKIFQNFHFQKHAPNMEKRLAKKNFTLQYLGLSHISPARKKVQSLPFSVMSHNVKGGVPSWRFWPTDGLSRMSNFTWCVMCNVWIHKQKESWVWESSLKFPTWRRNFAISPVFFQRVSHRQNCAIPHHALQQQQQTNERWAGEEHLIGLFTGPYPK